MTFRVVVLVSGTGTLLQALLDAEQEGRLEASVVAVGSEIPGCRGLGRARSAGVPTFVVPMRALLRRGSPERLAWDRALADAVDAHHPDLVVLAGFMKLLGEPFMTRFGGRVVNSHPALLPAFPGAHAVRDALDARATSTGATIFWVDGGVDSGTVITQRAVPVEPGDDEASLHERIKVTERRMLVDTLNELAATHGRQQMTDPTRNPIRRALVSVYDKTGLEDLGRALAGAGVEIVSTGSTAKKLADAGVPVTPVERLTGFPECLDGRVKTLHPAVHAGILADRRLESHRRQLDELGIKPFDLVVSNLYPFAQTVASGADFDACVEQIDIGGPSMVRAAAKNHPSVAIITSPGQYPELRTALDKGGFTGDQRRVLAAKAFAHTAAYDAAVASWMASQTTGEGMASFVGIAATKVDDLRYGENSHQAAAVYAVEGSAAGLVGARLLGGKAMSYNNYTDTDAARRAAYDFDQPAVAVIKHANPCGIAVGSDIAEAHRKAHACDPLSAYGGVIAANRPVSLQMAEQVKPIFTEVIVAPGFEPGALELLQTKKNLRILQAEDHVFDAAMWREISGGLLVSEPDRLDAPGDDPSGWKLVAGEQVDEATLADLLFAWKACRSVKSNAILLAHDGASVGVGMGQVNRVDSCRLAVDRAGDRAKGSVAASDAFFPFSDGPEILMNAGIRAIVEPGGSIRDEQTVEAAKKAGVALYFTGNRHFFH